jgi:hypothetical protein
MAIHRARMRRDVSKLVGRSNALSLKDKVGSLKHSSRTSQVQGYHPGIDDERDDFRQQHGVFRFIKHVGGAVPLPENPVQASRFSNERRGYGLAPWPHEISGRDERI